MLSGLNYIPDRPEAEILAEYVGIIDRLFEPSKFLARAYHHALIMRPTRRHTKLQEGNRDVPRKKAQLPWRKQVREFLGGLQLFWRHGVVASHRGQFWRQLWDLRRKNPSRLRQYLINCALGENFAWTRREVLRRASAKRNQAAATTCPPEAAKGREQRPAG